MKAQLWDSLKQVELVSGDAPQNMETESPWYVKILLAFSGWLAASFLLGFFFTLFSQLYKNIPLSLGIGFGLIISAYLLLKTKGNEFIEHLALAISLAGQVLILLGVDRYFHANNEAVIWLSMSVLQFALAFIMPNYVHRVFSSFFAGLGFAASLFYYQNSLIAPTVYGAFLMFSIAIIWLNEFKFPKQILKLQAIGYGLVLALITLNVTKIFTPYGILGHQYLQNIENSWFQPWMGEALYSVVTLFVVWQLLKKHHTKIDQKTTALALIGTLLLSLLSIQAHGIIVGVMIILLGFSASNRVLLGLGILSLLFFISHYYYSLENTLLDKSITLMVLGFCLLFARGLMLKLLPNSPKEAVS